MEVPSTLHSCSCSLASGMLMTSRNWAFLWCATYLVSPLSYCFPEAFLLAWSGEVVAVSDPWNCHIVPVSLKVSQASLATVSPGARFLHCFPSPSHGRPISLGEGQPAAASIRP